MKKSILVWLFVVAFPVSAAEKDYQEPWCHRHYGKLEHVLPDQTRVDCLTATHAVEVDWGHKWAEAIGQSLHYARKSGLRAGIVLIIVDDADRRGLEHLQGILEEYKLPIDLWILKTPPSIYYNP